MINGYKKEDFKVIILASMATIIESYDFTLYLLLSRIISEKFLLGEEYNRMMWSFSILSIGYCARPIGGILFGHFGDKYGRKFVFQLSILIMTVATCLLGLIPDYGKAGAISVITLVLCRFFQGIAIGGEIPGAIVFIYEQLSSEKKVKGMALVFSGIGVGMFLVTLVISFLNNRMDVAQMNLIGWKIPFLIGTLTGALCYVIMIITMMETPMFIKAQTEKTIPDYPFFVILGKYKWSIVLGLMLLICIDNIATLCFSLFPGMLVKVFKYSNSEAYFISITGTVAFTASMIVIGMFRKKLLENIWKYIMLYIASTVIMCFVFFFVYCHSILMISVSLVLLSLLTGVFFPDILIFISEMFPSEVRYTGVATVYNVSSALLGGFLPFTITGMFIQENTNIILVCYMATMCLIGIIFLFLFNAHRKKMQGS